MKLLCMNCGAVIEGSDELLRCPECGSDATPASLDDTLTIHITSHELRILTIWASNWAHAIREQHPDAGNPIKVILNRLAPQTDVPLTLSQEIADIRASFSESEVTVYDGHGEKMDL